MLDRQRQTEAVNLAKELHHDHTVVCVLCMHCCLCVCKLVYFFFSHVSEIKQTEAINLAKAGWKVHEKST